MGHSKLTSFEQETIQFHYSMIFFKNVYFSTHLVIDRMRGKKESKYEGGKQSNNYTSQQLLVTEANRGFLLAPGSRTEVSL